MSKNGETSESLIQETSRQLTFAGKRRGKEDDRYLWPEMLRIITALRPRWVLGENVPGLTRMGLDECLSDLEVIGYKTETFIIPACAVGAPNRRDRVWIIAYADRGGRSSEPWKQQGERSEIFDRSGQIVADPTDSRTERMCGRENEAPENGVNAIRYAECGGRDRESWGWSAKSGICGVAHGVPKRVERLKLLGNGMVVPLVYEIGRRIIEADRLAL